MFVLYSFNKLLISSEIKSLLLFKHLYPSFSLTQQIGCFLSAVIKYNLLFNKIANSSLAKVLVFTVTY